MRPFNNPSVAAKFEAYPPNVRRKMLALRELVFTTAATTPGVGDLEETLKWVEPAYVTLNKTGSTLRIDWKAKQPNTYSMYFQLPNKSRGDFSVNVSKRLWFLG